MTKNLIKSLAFLPVVTGTIAMTPAPASAFWNLFGPSHQQVCESILPDIEKSLPGYMRRWHNRAIQTGTWNSLSFAERRFAWGWVKPDEIQYSGNVTAVKTHRDIKSIGYKPVTGCVTQFTVAAWEHFDAETFILKYNLELDEQSGKYYYSMIQPRPLNS